MLDMDVMRELAVAEALNLSKLMTDNEKSRLIAELVNPQHKEECIYGLATGHCFSDRANELIKRAATKVYNVFELVGWVNKLSEIVKLNGEPWDFGGGRRGQAYYSPIEVLIQEDITTIPHLINIIKGIETTLPTNKTESNEEIIVP